MTVYERINNIMACLANDKTPKTAAQIAQKLNVPTGLIQRDIVALKKHPLFKDNIVEFNSNGTTTYNIHLKQLCNILSENDNGDTLYYKRFNHPTAQLLPLNQFDYKLYKLVDPLSYKRINHDDEHVRSKNNDLFIIKSTADPTISYNQEIIDTIKDAIKNELMIKYTDYNGSIHSFSPQVIKPDINTRQLYVINIDADDKFITSIPLDEISDVEITKEKQANPYNSLSKNDRYLLNCLWSFEYENIDRLYDNDGNIPSPTHVKLRFFDGTGNISEKIKLIESQRPTAKLSGPFNSSPEISDDAEDFYYYEDDILGINAFNRWLLQFGRSVVVLEPRELAYEIYRKIVADLE